MLEYSMFIKSSFRGHKLGKRLEPIMAAYKATARFQSLFIKSFAMTQHAPKAKR